MLPDKIVGITDFEGGITLNVTEEETNKYLTAVLNGYHGIFGRIRSSTVLFDDKLNFWVITGKNVATEKVEESISIWVELTRDENLLLVRPNGRTDAQASSSKPQLLKV